MIGIKDLYAQYIRKPLPEDCRIVCEPIDPYMAKLNRLLTDSISYFSYTLVLAGTADVDYNGNNLTLSPNDMMITTPGAKVFTSNVSDDYFALCLMVDETIVYEIQTARYAILTAYSPQLIHYQNKLTLSGIVKEVDGRNHNLRKVPRKACQRMSVSVVLNLCVRVNGNRKQS